jgi:uncharacterized protein
MISINDITKEFIDGLSVDNDAVQKKIAANLSILTGQVGTVAALLADGNTVPFIARYRKEAHGSLDEVAIIAIEHQLASLQNLETRRIEIWRGIFEQGKLTPELYENILKAQTAAELEDIYLPYKKKKKTRGMLAIEKGLEPLAALMLELEDAALVEKAAEFIKVDTENPVLSVETKEDALQGAMDILAERVSQESENRAAVKKFYSYDAKIIVKGITPEGGDEETEKKKSVYQMYWDYSENFSQIKLHRVLAINRGEREGKLDVKIDVDENQAVLDLQKKYTIHNEYHKTSIEDGLKRLLGPAVIRELRGDCSDAADDHGISVFSENLINLLMQQPIKGTRVLGVDPGIRTGTKCACLDDTGKYLHHFVIDAQRHKEEAKKALLENIKMYNVQLIAIGNGTGSKEVQDIVADMITDSKLDVLFTVVDEDGASVYSAGDIAREEFPDLDLTIRGAISIGRRLQDPLAELVKIEPKSIGVGLYQHDVNQKKLSERLDEVVFGVVNKVGVNLNTASASLLKYVSGINSLLAKKIVKYRDENGKIKSRAELKDVPGMGPKSFEQCAGFLRIPESADALDSTWVHPENYEVAREISKFVTYTGNLGKSELTELKEKYKVGDTTINDIVLELKKPGRDPREGFPKPILQKGVINFEDLTEGMTVTGKIKNVVDFGAFVDLGIKETALVHISELSDNFVKDPMEVVKVGDVLEFRIIALDTERKRISLSRKSQSGEAAGGDFAKHDKDAGAKSAAGKKVVVIKKKPGGSGGSSSTHSSGGSVGRPKSIIDTYRIPRNDTRSSAANGNRNDNDGTTYNAFAEALKKAREQRK